MNRRLAFLVGALALLPSASFAGSGTDWLKPITAGVDDLVTSHAPALVSMGQIELGFVGLITLVAIVCNWQLAHMTIGHRPVNYTIGDFIIWMIKLLICSTVLTNYGSLHTVFAAVAQSISSTLDQGIMDDFTTRVSAAVDGTHQPSSLDLLGVIMYFLVMVQMAIIDGALFAIDAFGWVAYGVFALFGPLFVPLFMTKYFNGKFWGWLDGMIVFSFYPAVASALTYVWLNVLIGFFDHTIAGDYSIGHWIAMAIALGLLMIGFVYGMFKIPMLTSMLFGGVGSAAQGFSDSAMNIFSQVAEAAFMA